jgi:cell wall-associated NlpC family hydrolase
MAILRPYFTPYLQPNPAQLLQNIQGNPQLQQQPNAYQNYFQPQVQQPTADQQQQYEQPSFNTEQSIQDQYNKVQQNRQNQFQPNPVVNNPVAATQTNPITNFMQTSAARPNFQQFYDRLSSISNMGQDATDAAQAQAVAKQQQLLASVNSSNPALNTSVGSVAGAANRVSIAKSLIGVPYVWGHQDKNGTDCSGLVYQVLNASGTKVPRVTAAEYGKMGSAVSLAQAQPGDVVYFDEPGATDHVGIYVGNGQMIDAPYTGANVRIDKIGNPTSIRRIGTPQQGQGGNIIGAGAGVNAVAAKPWQSNQKLGQQLLAQAGLGGQWNSFNQLEMHEAGWNNTARNPSSTAYGIGQFLNSTWGSTPKTSDPRVQITAMLNYIKSRYGDPNKAWQFWQQHHWY